MAVDAHTSTREGYLGAIAVPGVHDIGADVARGLAVPLQVGAHVHDLVLDGHGEEGLNLDLEQHGAIVRVAVILHVALVEAGVLALQIGHENDAVEVHEDGLALQRVAHAVHNAVPLVVGDGIALGDALEGGVEADAGQLAIGEDLGELGPDARITLRSLRAHNAQIGGLARLRGHIPQVGIARHHGANVVARVAAGHARKVQVAVARDESLPALLHLLREHIEEPDVVDVLGVLVVVEAVDDRFAEAARNHRRPLALLESIEHDLAQLHDIRVDRAEVVGGLAVVAARVLARRPVYDQVAAVLKVALVEQVYRVELVLGAQARVNLNPVPPFFFFFFFFLFKS